MAFRSHIAYRVCVVLAALVATASILVPPSCSTAADMKEKTCCCGMAQTHHMTCAGGTCCCGQTALIPTANIEPAFRATVRKSPEIGPDGYVFATKTNVNPAQEQAFVYTCTTLDSYRPSFPILPCGLRAPPVSVHTTIH